MSLGLNELTKEVNSRLAKRPLQITMVPEEQLLLEFNLSGLDSSYGNDELIKICCDLIDKVEEKDVEL